VTDSGCHVQSRVGKYQTVGCQQNGQFDSDQVRPSLTAAPSVSSMAAQEQFCREEKHQYLSTGKLIYYYTLNLRLYVLVVLVWWGSEVVVSQVLCQSIICQAIKVVTPS